MLIKLSFTRIPVLRTTTPVTFLEVANHDANSFPCKRMENVKDLTKTSCYKESREMLRTSATEDVLPTLISYENGFVHTIMPNTVTLHHAVCL